VSTPEEALRAGLTRARDLGFLGPGAVTTHLEHANRFAAVADEHLDHTPRSYLDLGTGGGVPGLVLALQWPDASGVLIESAHRRAEHLRTEIASLGIDGRTAVVEERAEIVAHEAARREGFELVTARSFAGPATTAEIACGFVAPGGFLIVSEPPEADDARWPADGLSELGFGPARRVAERNAHFVVIVKQEMAPAHLPRGVGRPGKRPRW
jgi:16S rRNA (guanine527-N7)-methyltransferase